MFTYEHTLVASVRLANYMYHTATRQLGYDADDIKDDLIGGSMTEKEAEQAQTKLSRKYLEIMTKSSNKTLKAILDAHEVKICRRTNKTLEAIKTELFERALYEEDSGKTGTIANS